MSPYSQERANWIEARLFCLANMSREHAQRGRQRSVQYVSGNEQEAYAAFHETAKQIQAERLMLMAERQVIEDYKHDNEVRAA